MTTRNKDVILARLSKTAFLLGFALLVGSGVLYCLEDRPGVTIEDVDRDAGTVTAGSTTNLVFHIQNPTRHNARVVGLGEC